MENNNIKWAEIDLDALRWNMEQIRRLAGPDIRVAAVVKANGYGHGALEIMDTLLEAGADVIVVSSVNEAVEMRKKYRQTPTLVLGAAQPSDIEEAIRYGVIQTISSEEQAEEISRKARRLGVEADCHIKLDTGMNRIGFPVNEESAEAILRISRLPGIRLGGMFSHFATADEEEKSFSRLQYDRFCRMKKMLDDRGLRIPVCHIANSAAIIDFPEVYMDMVRSGIITYGIYPSDEVDRSRIPLKPVMSLRARISHVKTLDEDAGISYGLTDSVKAGSVIATVPVGYADGYLRALSSRGEVLVKGQRARIRGRVCMDQLMIDVTHIPGIKTDDIVTLVGRDGDQEITMDEVAALAGTISYELLCMVGRRVPRVYLENGKIKRITNYLAVNTKKYVIALDQGTTSSRAIIFDKERNIIGIKQKEFPQIFPRPGWVEHDPMDIYSTQMAVLHEVVAAAGISTEEIAAIGITNQRETTLVWDRRTGEPVYNAIVWQCSRTSKECEEYIRRGYGETVREKTGLLIDSYFSATKIRWILDHVPGARQRAEAGELLFGTVDTWLVWKMTGGKVHVTDMTNASRTMLFNIRKCCWDKELLDLFDIPESMLPKVCSSSEVYGMYDLPGEGPEVPICGMAGDQQAALFGQACFEAGQAKNTYGTGCFMLMNIGDKCRISDGKLVTTIGIALKDRVQYAVEGSVFVGGAVIQWLRDGLQVLTRSSDSEAVAVRAGDNGGVFFVPAFTGLGAPYWDMYARGAILGITRGTTRDHIIRAAVESMAFQSMELLEALEKEAGISIQRLRVDGGACDNDFLMQFQSDVSDVEIERPAVRETTALGAACLAGLAVGFWESLDDLSRDRRVERVFIPRMEPAERQHLSDEWKKAVNRTLEWAK